MKHHGNTMKLEWHRVELKLKAIACLGRGCDPYILMNTVMPLRNRYASGERSVALYQEIMDIELDSLKEKAQSRK